LLDAIVFEQLGIPAVALITEPFMATCNALADMRSMPSYQFVTLPHPITSMTKTQIDALAETIAPQVEKLLTTNYTLIRTTTTKQSLEVALIALNQSLGDPLRADGADLTITQIGPTHLQFQLHVDNAACAECVMPTPFLHQLFTERTRHELGDTWTIQLVDPR
jgi:DNA topoisomerase VI subunit B